MWKPLVKRDEPAKWGDETARDLQLCTLAGWSDLECACLFNVPVCTIAVWRKKLTSRFRKQLDMSVDKFAADSDLFLATIELRALTALEDAHIGAAQAATMLKQAREARLARIQIRKDTGRWAASSDKDRDPNAMSDDEVQAELADLDKKISRLDPAKPRKSRPKEYGT